MDQIKIEKLEVYAGHGVYAHEQENGQLFWVSAVLYTDLRRAGETDALQDSTHYGEVCRLMQAWLQGHTYQLIEAAAEHLAREVLLRFPLVREIEIELCKPHAQIGIPFENVSVKIRRGWKQVYLGIGSNLGDKQRYLENAVTALKQDERIREVRCSSWTGTKPYGGVEQEDFLNGVLELYTLYEPWELLALLQKLEADAGRERKVHWGPRTLDLDILFFEGFVSVEPALCVPHPDMENREFVLKPMMELNPYYRHPVNGKSIKQMFQELEGRKPT